jgi:hypothetical protein
MKKRNYKGILGLNTVKAFIVVILALAIIAVITLIVLGSLSTETMVTMGGRPIEIVVTNETTSSITQVPQNLKYATENSIVCSDFLIVNSSEGILISSTNYTATSSCTIAITSGANMSFNNSDWLVSYTANYKNRDEIQGVVANTSTGIIGFFGNSLTFFALLGVVVIILIISLVVVVVNRFGGEGGMGTTNSTPSL